MVNLPHQLAPVTEDDRAWLLRRLDTLRALVTQGGHLRSYDTTEFGADGTRLVVLHFVCRSDDWLAEWKATSLPRGGATPGTAEASEAARPADYSPATPTRQYGSPRDEDGGGGDCGGGRDGTGVTPCRLP